MHFKVYEVQNVLTAALERNALKERVVLLEHQIDLLNKQIEIRTAEFERVLAMDSLNQVNIELYKSIIRTMESQRKTFEDAIKVLEKDVKRWRRKTRLTAIAGVITVGGVIYLSTR